MTVETCKGIVNRSFLNARKFWIADPEKITQFEGFFVPSDGTWFSCLTSGTWTDGKARFLRTQMFQRIMPWIYSGHNTMLAQLWRKIVLDQEYYRSELDS